MDEDLYDEFGNYIGPELDSSDSEESEFEDQDEHIDQDEHMVYEEEDQQMMTYDEKMELSGDGENRIILHEDKKYYPDAEEVYPGVKTILLDEDAQDLEEPIIKPIRVKNFSVLEKEQPALTYEPSFMTSLMNNPLLLRHFALLGHFHHGKTLFMDSLISVTQEKPWDVKKEIKYADTRLDEQQRGLSVKATAVSLVLENLAGKSYLLNAMDCPGHINFADESTAALRVCDGAVLVVDVVEGVMMNTERLLKSALREGVSVCVVLNKMDRLILELKLPPHDAYFKIMHTLEDINRIIELNSLPGCARKVSPELGNVCFASGQHGWSFTLASFASKYASKADENFDVDAFSKRLWGEWYFNDETRAITRAKNSGNGSAFDKTFVSFILEPLYKLYSQVIGEDPDELVVTLKRYGVALKHREVHMDPKPLLKIVMSRYFGYPRGFVDMVVKCIPPPCNSVEKKLSLHYTGYGDSLAAIGMRSCDPNGPLVINVVKLFSSPDGNKFHALGRVFSGTVKSGQQVKVLGEAYTQEDEEDMGVCEITSLAVSVGRFSIEISSARAGNWVMLEGVDGPIKKTATIIDMGSSEDSAIFRPLQFDTSSVVKLAVEPLKPAELPKMVEALRRINKSYPLVSTKVEESGEHVIMGTGELYMDCVMHDLRHLFSDIEVKVADPVVSFCETVVETSSMKCFALSANQKNKITMLAEPLEEGLANDIEMGNIRLDWDKKSIGDFFQKKYEWDLLASRSVWAFGPDVDGPCLLLDDTLPSEVDKNMLKNVKDGIVQGFRWGCREGPLCDEPIRNTKFKILDATIADTPFHRGSGQIIPTSRRAAYSAFLMATPRLMEPVYLVEIQSPPDCVQAIYPVLARRRGHVVQDAPKPGAPFYTVRAYLPIMDSFGFETDLRSYTQGQVFCQQVFDHWAVVTGHPLDRNVILHPLEPSPPNALARDFMVKTRRRKGLSEDVAINKYFDDPMLLEVWKEETQNGHD